MGRAIASGDLSVGAPRNISHTHLHTVKALCRAGHPAFASSNSPGACALGILACSWQGGKLALADAEKVALASRLGQILTYWDEMGRSVEAQRPWQRYHVIRRLMHAGRSWHRLMPARLSWESPGVSL